MTRERIRFTSPPVTGYDPTMLEGADVRGNPHVDEPGGPIRYWKSVIDKRGFRDFNFVRVETLVDLFFVVWLIEFVTAIVLLIGSFK